MKGKNNYPNDVSAAFNYLNNYQGDRWNVKLRSEELHFKNMASEKITEADGNQPLRDYSNRT